MKYVENKNVDFHKEKREKSGYKWLKPEKPKLLILSNRDWASIGLRLSDAINRYTDWSSDCVSAVSNLIINPLKPTGKNAKKIMELMKEADVIIFGSSFYGWIPYNAPINSNAMLGIMHIGTAYRSNHKKYNLEIHPKLDFVVVSHDFKNLCENPIVILNPIDTEKHKLQSRPRNPIIIGHSPSGWGKNKERGSVLKGTNYFIEAMKILNQKYGNKIQLDIIQDITLDECLERKKKCHIFFDQIVDENIAYKRANGEIPMYGTSLIEGACFGSVCLSQLGELDESFSCLYNVKNSDDIVNVVSYFMDNPDELIKVGNKTRYWVVEKHGYQAVATKFIRDLEEKLCGL